YCSESPERGVPVTETVSCIVSPLMKCRRERRLRRAERDRGGQGSGAVRLPHEAAGVEYERDGAVAEDRRRRNPLEPRAVRLETLQHHLLLPEKLVDEEARAPAVRFDDHHDALVELARPRRQIEQPVE